MKSNDKNTREDQRDFDLNHLSSFAKSRGFIYQSSAIYGGFPAVYDYAHYGVLLKNNIQKAWWENMVKRQDVFGLDSAIFMHPMTWKASGHVDSFADPEIDCKNCNARMRVDHLLEPLGYEDVDRMTIEEVNTLLEEIRNDSEKSKLLKCQKCGSTDLTNAKRFELLVKSNLGSPTSDLTNANITYLRGETCQGIYLNYKNYIQNLRAQIPFGIAQVGKAFRNEIVARQFTFRQREFTQMEFQYFIHPDDTEKYYDYWKEQRLDWYSKELGIPQDKIKIKPHTKLAHYAKKAEDITFFFRSLNRFEEVEGLHQRGDWDLSQHQKFSKEKLDFFDQTRGERFIPHIVETSVGLDRLVLAVLDYGLHEEELEDGSTRTVLKIKKELAPIRAAVFPLTKDEKLMKIAQDIYDKLSKDYFVEFDKSGSIGKRYRRQDEIGTPSCITVDFDSLEDETVTIRDRGTMKQKRVAIEEVAKHI